MFKPLQTSLPNSIGPRFSVQRREREREVRMVRENGPIARHEPDRERSRRSWIFIADFSMEETWPGGVDKIVTSILLPVSGLIHADQTTRLTPIPSLLSFPSRPWPQKAFTDDGGPVFFKRDNERWGAVEPRRAKYNSPRIFSRATSRGRPGTVSRNDKTRSGGERGRRPFFCLAVDSTRVRRVGGWGGRACITIRLGKGRKELGSKFEILLRIGSWIENREKCNRVTS